METPPTIPADDLDINKTLWDERVGHHLDAPFYAMEAFRKGTSSLREIESALLGNISGKDVLHLQCYFGQDTLSLARMGARASGLDFSPKAIAVAEELAKELGLQARFVCDDVYAATTYFKASADLVFTTYGTIGWLPDIARWAQVVADCLRPGGELLFVDFHPVVWMMDDAFQRPTYSYFNQGPIIEQLEGTYADRDASIKATSVGWNHSLGEVWGALSAAGLRVTHFAEYDFSPYPAFQNAIEVAPGRWQISGLEGVMPMVYSLKADKAAS